MNIVSSSCRTLSNDERRAAWAARYYGAGLHRRLPKPRVRVKPRIRINKAPAPSGKDL